MDQIKRLLKPAKFQPVRYGRGATHGEIQVAESELGVSFPASYRQFLSTLGWIESSYLSVYGLGIDVELGSSVVFVTNSERHEMDLCIPPTLIPIVNDGSGNLYCLDVSQMQESECPVVFWDHESFEGAEQMPERVGPDFYNWLITELAELSR